MELSPGTPCASHPMCGFQGTLPVGRAIVPGRVIQQLGGTAGLGTLGRPQQGQEAGARATGGCPAVVEVIAGAASRAHGMLVPGKLGGACLLGPKGSCASRGAAAPPPTALCVGEAADKAAFFSPPPKRGQPHT